MPPTILLVLASLSRPICNRSRCVSISARFSANGRTYKYFFARGQLDVERMRVDTATLALVSRLHNPGWYARMSDLFQLRRLNPADWTLRAPEDGADKNDLLGRN